MKEIWKDVVGYEGLYKVSNLGNVKSIRTNKLLCFSISNKRYFRVGLCKNGKRKWSAIHRLVAEAFIPNPNNFPCVNHKDCNKQNNKLTNLEWCSYSYNNLYKNHQLKRIASLMIYYFKKDYPNEKELINNVQQIKDRINLL